MSIIDNIWIHDGWINVDGIGRIGRYLKDVQTIGLDYSMKWIVGTNERIPCKESEIKEKVITLFKDERKI